MLSVKQRSCEYQYFKVIGLDLTGNELESAAPEADALTSPQFELLKDNNILLIDPFDVFS